MFTHINIILKDEIYLKLSTILKTPTLSTSLRNLGDRETLPFMFCLCFILVSNYIYLNLFIKCTNFNIAGIQNFKDTFV